MLGFQIGLIRRMLNIAHHHHAIVKAHGIVFQWLPSHCISGNDLADATAEKAHEGTNPVRMPLS